MIDTSVRRSVMESIGNSSGKRRQFTEEFKADAVALVLDGGRSMADVARSLDVTYQTLVIGYVRLKRIVVSVLV